MIKITAVLVALFPLVLAAQNFPIGKPEENGFSSQRLARIDQMVQEHVEKKQIPGAVVLIARNGKVVYHKAFGFKDIDAQAALKTNDIFRIASQTKAITSLAIMLLWEEGKFLLDEPISKYAPEFKNPKVLNQLRWSDTTYSVIPAKGEITFRHLLTHTSGIDYATIGSQEFTAIYAKAGVPSGIGNDNMVLADKMKILGTLPLKHHPGEKYTYGLNTDVLGYLVEILSGQPLDRFFQDRIFKPLGMTDTYFYLPKDKHARLVALYETNEKGLKRMTGNAYDRVHPDYPTLAGRYFSGGAGLSSTAEDYAKFLQLFLNNGTLNGQRLISRKTVELMLTNQIQPPLTNQFGLGFGLETDKNDFESVVSKGSFSWGGAFNTHYWADPKEKLVGIIFTNMYNSPYWNIGDRYRVLVYQAISD
jgi:CubicO group peptidase (beta-lactamase class C family)